MLKNPRAAVAKLLEVALHHRDRLTTAVDADIAAFRNYLRTVQPTDTDTGELLPQQTSELVCTMFAEYQAAEKVTLKTLSDAGLLDRFSPRIDALSVAYRAMLDVANTFVDDERSLFGSPEAIRMNDAYSDVHRYLDTIPNVTHGPSNGITFTRPEPYPSEMLPTDLGDELRRKPEAAEPNAQAAELPKRPNCPSRILRK